MSLLVQTFVRSGRIDVGYKTPLDYIGSGGRNWSSTSSIYSSYINSDAYYFSLYPSHVSPSHGPVDRYVGYPVRCLV